MATTAFADVQDGTGISAFEAEHLIESIQELQIADIGSSRWFQQHKSIEKLNIQAHMSTQNNTDPFITELFVSTNKVKTLVHNLLVIEAWKTKIFPKVVKEAAVASVRAYFILFHEATLLNLLEVIMYSKEATMSIDEYLYPLVNYCARKFSYLDDWEWEEMPAEKIMSMLQSSDEESLLRNDKELRYVVAISSISILRYITDVVSELPLSIITSILSVHDFICSFGKNGRPAKLAYFEGGVWKECDLDDVNRIRKVEAQVWILLYNLLMDNECRRKYTYTPYNHGMVLRLKPFLTETSIDQIPILSDLLRYVEELSLMDVSLSSNNTPMLFEISEPEQQLSLDCDVNLLASQFSTMMRTEAARSRSDDIKGIQNVRNAVSRLFSGARDARTSGIAEVQEKLSSWGMEVT
ncbi:hypothetical protein BC829DRAFT_448712 [Chytridium lagenaria]|nr:hypothetical protein BC829DRAFT_448712 [Chytridium lagenaria]